MSNKRNRWISGDFGFASWWIVLPAASKNPDALMVLIQLLATGAEEAKNKNTKFVTQSLQYGKHAIELIHCRPLRLFSSKRRRSTGLGPRSTDRGR